MAMLAGALVSAPSHARGYRTGTKILAPGVTYTWINDPLGPWRIRVVSIDLSQTSTLDVELAQDRLPGLETTSSIAVRSSAMVAINGDFFRPEGRPVNAYAEDGALLQTSLIWGRNFAVNGSETAVFMDHPEVQVWLRELDGPTHTIGRLNAGDPVIEEVAAYTPESTGLERPPRDACAARLTPLEGYVADPATGGLEAGHEVAAVRCAESRLRRRGGVIVATPIEGAAALALGALTPSEQVRLGWSLGWPDVRDTIGGNPTLIEYGAVVESNVSGTHPFMRRHPRTGVGSTPDGRVLLVTVDGRQPGYSVGMTMREFADLFMSLGADWALNLDGGGSTTMVVNGRVKNRPSDPDGERPVGNALLLLPAGDPGDTADDPPAKAIGKIFPGNPSVTDPASAGGLLSWLRARGLMLDPGLQRIARAFKRR